MATDNAGEIGADINTTRTGVAPIGQADWPRHLRLSCTELTSNCRRVWLSSEAAWPPRRRRFTRRGGAST